MVVKGYTLVKIYVIKVAITDEQQLIWQTILLQMSN